MFAHEMSRFWRTVAQSLISPVLSTSLYFVVWHRHSSRIEQVEGDYGAFIVPGLIMLSVITQAISERLFGIYFPKFIGTIYEHLSAPVSFLEIVFGMCGRCGREGRDHRCDNPDYGVFFVDLPTFIPSPVSYHGFDSASFARASSLASGQIISNSSTDPLVTHPWSFWGAFYSVSMLLPAW